MKVLKKFLLLFIIIFPKANALNYTISFAGSGLNSTVDSVVVQNITKKTATVVSQGYELVLTDVTTESSNLRNDDETTIMPAVDGKNYILSFNAKIEGECRVYVYNFNGTVVSEFTDNLQAGVNLLDITAPCGVYIVKVTGKNYSYCKKFVSQSPLNLPPAISFRNLIPRNKVLNTKTTNFITMQYASGDQLIYSGKSGNNCTLIADVPNGDKTISFEFHECKDKNGKYYPVTKIGTQVWMAENLAYLPEAATNDPTIGAEDAGNSGKAFYYVKDLAKYGVLYNWYASQTAAPDGWHIPSNTEWTVLTTYLGGNLVAAGKLKSTTNWNNPNSGTNESCFSAPGGGARDTGGIIYAGSYGYWWSSSQSGPYGWFIMLNNTSNGLNMYNDYTYIGRSIRCVMD